MFFAFSSTLLFHNKIWTKLIPLNKHQKKLFHVIAKLQFIILAINWRSCRWCYNRQRHHILDDSLFPCSFVYNTMWQCFGMLTNIYHSTKISKINISLIFHHVVLRNFSCMRRFLPANSLKRQIVQSSNTFHNIQQSSRFRNIWQD